MNKLSQSLVALVPTLFVLSTITAHAEESEIKQLETITVEGKRITPNYSTKQVNISGFGSNDIRKVPASVATITSDLLTDQHAKGLTDVIKNDASTGDGYAAIGYYPNIVARGFALNLASSYLLNGNLIRGEQNIALENKEQVEILKGASAIQNGMSTPGGIVNYVTKRPMNIRSLSFDIDENGDNTVATDFGGFLGQNQQFGYRINLANQNIRSYVEHANGERLFGSLAFDWEIDEKSKLQFDIESQRQQQRSVPGYQLLDGKIVPTNVKWDRLLAYRDWANPVTNKSLNTSLQYQYQFNDDWAATLTAAHSKVVLDDYSSFAWGCYSSVCETTGLGNTFDKNGNYDVSNYRNPDDTYETNQYKAALAGSFNTADIVHNIKLEFAQTDKERNRYKSINQTVGYGNIYTGEIVQTETPNTQIKGNKYKAVESKQTSITALDRVEWNPEWSTLLGGKWIQLDETAYKSSGKQTRNTDTNKFLPQLAVVYSPWEKTNLYASYSEGLTEGGTAPWYATNADQSLEPVKSTQYELGLKQQIKNFLFTTALFDIKQDNQDIHITADKKFDFISQGKQHNYGIEFGLNGNLTEALKINSSLALINARLIDIETEAYKGHQVQNVPKVRFSSYAPYDIAQIEGLSVLGGLRYSSSKNANKDATAKVSGYTLFDLGANYNLTLSGYQTTLRFNVDNLFNKKYWRDVGGSGGDDYLFLGNPRTAKFSVSVNF